MSHWTRKLVLSTLVFVALGIAAGCGGKRSDAEISLLAWTRALNLHMASDFEGGNHYPLKLVDIDPALRIELLFDDPWGAPIYYRKFNDSQFDLASAGPDGDIGNDDDVVIQDRTLKKAANAWATRPPGKGLVAQRASDRPTSEGEERLTDDGGAEDVDAGLDDDGGETDFDYEE